MLGRSGWSGPGRLPYTSNLVPGGLSWIPKGCSSTGRAAVSKTAGCRFKSCRPCCRSVMGGVEDGMAEGREQDQPEEREGAVRPSTAAARRERRASSRPAARKDGSSAESKKSAVESDSSDDDAKKGRPTKT